jgi:hypothetical protein
VIHVECCNELQSPVTVISLASPLMMSFHHAMWGDRLAAALSTPGLLAFGMTPVAAVSTPVGVHLECLPSVIKCCKYLHHSDQMVVLAMMVVVLMRTAMMICRWPRRWGWSASRRPRDGSTSGT